MLYEGTLVRYREGTAKAGEVYLVAEDFSPARNGWAVMLADSGRLFWANPQDLELAE